jgi:beta-mannosidase
MDQPVFCPQTKTRHPFHTVYSPASMLRASVALAALLAVLTPISLFGARPAAKSAAPSLSTETLLSGATWKLGSFEMDQGEPQGAFKSDFNDSSFRTVSVPGEVQLQTGLKGKDLFLQSKALNLINNKEWWYRKTFNVPASAAGKLVRLQFDAVDYFSSVWVNGEKVGGHEGAAEPFTLDISRQVKPGADNILVVKVTCPWLPKGRGLTEYVKSSFSLQVDGGSTPNISKLPYFLGGSWGGIPVYGNNSLTMGVVKDVKLLVSEPVIIEDLHVYAKTLNADGSATLEITGNAKNFRDGQGEAKIDIDLAPANFTGETTRVPPITLSVKPGDNTFEQEAVVQKAQLWWTWDLGAQNLYHATARLSAAAGGLGNVAETTFGIRTITRDADLSYRLNGKRIFIRGVWYPMVDYYASRATRQTYERDLKELRAAYANHLVTQMMEKDEFYQECDQFGLLIFVQMPFTQFGPYQVVEKGNPRREPFIDNSREQVRGMVLAVRNHPSVIQWSPLAEARDSGKWAGPQEGYDYFIAEMQKVITELSPDTIFHASLCDLGEHHTWNSNYRYFNYFQPLLISEYGEISPPNIETWLEALTPDQMWSDKNPRRIYNMPVDLEAYKFWNAWEYNDAGFGVFNMFREVHTYIDQNPTNAQELVDDLQLQHAFTLGYATDAFRRKMHNPINGIRTWAYRDIYPGVQFGMVDSNGIPKMNYYYYKRAQTPLTVSFAFEPELESQPSGKHLQIPVWVASDYRRNIPLDVKVEILTPSGEAVWSKTFDGEAPEDASRQVGLVDWTTPEKPGVYILRGHATEKGGPASAVNTMFVKVTPRAFDKAPRVLLIGWKKFDQPIASILKAFGADVDVIDENSFDRLAELKNAAALRAKYDVVWLAPVDMIWKQIEPAMGDGLAEAVRQGVGFIHSGGNAAFHGGEAIPACLDLTRIAELLPVTLRTADEDPVYPPFVAGQALPIAQQTIHEIKSVDAAWSDAGLNDYGLSGYNWVDEKPQSKVVLTIEGHPLVAVGQYGQGHTVAFTGFTPTWDALGDDFLDEQFDNLPVTRAYFGIFEQVLAAATGARPTTEFSRLLAAREKPLFQILKEQPATTMQATVPAAKADGNRANLAIALENGKNYARLVRLRIVWDGPQPYMSLYGDNFFDLMPGEAKQVSLELAFPDKLTAPAHGKLIVLGSNLAATEIPITVNP